MKPHYHPALSLTISLLALAVPCRAATITVTSLQDDGGTGELRSAIVSANAAPKSTIKFSSALHGTISLTSALPDLTQPVTIAGPGASVIAISGAGKYRPFYVTPASNASGATTVTISGLTIKDGGDEADLDVGGAIVVSSGQLELLNCELLDNTGYDTGGAIYTSTGTVTTITDCLFKHNSAILIGGALTNEGTAYILQGSVIGNTAPNGGGIKNDGTLTILDSTIENNIAPASPFVSEAGSGHIGGGISNDGSLTLLNSTVIGNKAADSEASDATGGGLDNNNFGTATVSDVTFTGNTADIGGALHNDSTSTATLTNSIAYGDNANEITVDPSSSVTVSYSDIHEGIAAVAGATDGGNNFAKDPRFEPSGLAYNGESTQTLALLSDSPCYGAGNAATSPQDDQRGELRAYKPSVGAFDVTELPSISPITSFTPSFAYASGPDFTLTVHGTNYVDGAMVSIGGIDLATTFVSSTQLSVVVSSTERAVAAVYGVVVTNPGNSPSLPTPFKIKPRLTTLSLSTSTAIGSTTLTGTVALNGVADASGVTVALQSSDPAIAAVPPSVSIEAGHSSATFAIATSNPPANTPVTISGAATDSSASAKLTVDNAL